MKRIFLILFSFFVCIKGFAQVINVESKRFLKDTNGFVGKIDLSFSINQNTQQVIQSGTNVHAQYKKDNHRVLAIGDLYFIKAGKQDFVNSGYQHFRYNYKFAKRLTWETFIQAQYNKILLLDRRYLTGTGPRLRVIKKEHIKLYLAALYMYEYQSQNYDSLHKFNNRMSTYFTLSLDFKKIDFTTTTFYQPNMANLNDYRIANDSSFELVITNALNFKVGFNLLYDTRQPLGVPALMYVLKNGVSFKF